MSCLPLHGVVECNECYETTPVIFDRTVKTDGAWRITANPLAWGNPYAEIIVLGFSKGPSQAGTLSNIPHNDIAYKTHRVNVGKILSHLGLLPKGDNAFLKNMVDKREPECQVSTYDKESQSVKSQSVRSPPMTMSQVET